SLLNFPPIDFTGLIRDSELVEPKRLREAKKNVYRIPDLLQVSGNEITSKLGRLFEFIEEKMVVAQQPMSPDAEDEPWTDPTFEARLVLAHNKANIDKINALSKMVSQYTANLRNMFSRVDEFVILVNSFIQDSNKRLEYDESGALSFRVGYDHVERDLRTLSSGEIQIIVIFAHLYFNPETKRANVFIIDEPELSLHVQWQAKFVDALIEASHDTQFVMATHSPTVIMNRIDHCVEMTKVE
ncbi:ATP-binding protein, partial [Rhodovulum sulfidophilum]|uniref:AAA family ATPase n=1 Tax=Rhodovulum sulfidophilum TaxID=35806 RepID=UPI001923BCA0